MTPQTPDDRAGADPAVPDDIAELAGRLFDMARAGDAETLGAYLDAGVPVDLRNQAGDSLLMLAAYHGSAPTVAVLLAHGAAPDVANDKGQTPLAGAVFKGHDEVVAALVRAGADPYAGAPTAHAAAQMFGRADYVRFWQPDGEPAGDERVEPGPERLQ